MKIKDTEYPHITLNEKGVPTIDGTRMKVSDVVAYHRAGINLEELAQRYRPVHTIAQFYSALAYYYDHKDEMDRDAGEREGRAAQALAEIEARQGPSKIRQMLRAQGRPR